MPERFLDFLGSAGLVISPGFSIGISLQMLREVQMRAPELVTVLSCTSADTLEPLFPLFQTAYKMPCSLVILMPFFTDHTRICTLKSLMPVICHCCYQSRWWNLGVFCSLFWFEPKPENCSKSGCWFVMIRDSQDGAGQSICRSPSGLGITLHLPGDSSGPRPDQDMGMWMGTTQWSPWPGRAGLWDLPTGPAAGSLGQGLGPGELPWAPEPWAGWKELWRGDQGNQDLLVH